MVIVHTYLVTASWREREKELFGQQAGGERRENKVRCATFGIHRYDSRSASRANAPTQTLSLERKGYLTTLEQLLIPLKFISRRRKVPEPKSLSFLSLQFGAKTAAPEHAQ